MCLYMWLCALAPERLSYPSCPPLLWLLNQMVPSFLAVPGHLAPQPTTVWDPEPCRRFITPIESTQTQPLLTSPSVLLSHQLSSLPPPCMPAPLLCHSFLSRSVKHCLFIFIVDSFFINAAFPLSLLHGPLFLVGRVHRESRIQVLVCFYFLLC